MDITHVFSYIKIPVTILHVVAVVLGMGAALVSDLLFTFFAKDKRLSSMERKTLDMLSSVVWYGLIVMFVSGVALFFSDAPRYLASHKFLAKMTILTVLLMNGYMLNTRVWPHLMKPGFFTAKSEAFTRKLAFGSGAVSVISWLSVCILGVLDSSPAHYLVLTGVYGAVLLGGISVALIIENRELESSAK